MRGSFVKSLKWKHVALGLLAASVIWLLLFSSFFTNWPGLEDSLRTYLPWLKRAGATFSLPVE